MQTIDTQLIDELAEKYTQLKKEIGKVIVGQEEAIEIAILSILCNGHCLLIGVPGLAKTLLIRTFSQVLNISFNRVQFTPDLMPSDITGSEILNNERSFEFIKGPIFSNIILADEINRTPPKTQAALLEAMQEKKITVNGKTYELPKPFFVLATQNPIEQEGTYPLPEAQLDRFIFSSHLDYPSLDEEKSIVTAIDLQQTQEKLGQILDADMIIKYQNLIKEIPITEHLIDYAVKLVRKTRPKREEATEVTNKYIQWGAGPRASQYMILAAKCLAGIYGKYAPDIEDIQKVAIPILSHRIIKNYKAESDNLTEADLIKQLF